MANQQDLNNQTTPLGVQPTTGQISVDQQRNQMLAQISAFLGVISGGGGATNGSVFAFTNVTSNTALTSAMTSIAVDASGGAVILTLPLALTAPGKMFFIKKTDLTANTVKIIRQGSDLIERATSVILYFPGEAISPQSFGGTTWWLY